MPRGKKLKRLTKEEHIEAARLLCGVLDGLKDGLNLVGPAIGAERMDVVIKLERSFDVRVVMHLQDAWDDDFGPEGNPYRKHEKERAAAWYQRRGLAYPWA